MTDQQRPLRGRNHLGKQAKSGSGYDDCSDDENVADIDYAPSIEDTGTSRFYHRPSNLLKAFCQAVSKRRETLSNSVAEGLAV